MRVKIEYSEGSSYEGLYSVDRDQFQDFGVLKVNNKNWKAEYEGFFHRGLFCKKGTLRIGDDYVYEGEFKKNMRNGFGKEKKRNEFIYEGHFYKNFKDGLGRLVTKNYIMKGNFKRSQLSGICQVYFIHSKNIYRGELTRLHEIQQENQIRQVHVHRRPLLRRRIRK